MDTKVLLWKLLWDYDPNGLIVLDSTDMKVRLANPAFCKMMRVNYNDILGRKGVDILGDVDDFIKVWRTRLVNRGIEREYPHIPLYVRQVIFPISQENLVAAIFVDLTKEWQQEKELAELKREAITEVTQVVNKQMSVAQEIAGLLGETTAEIKVSLLRLLDMLEKEDAGENE
ncbi:MAG: PAS domain-containing protein [Desulfobacteraceae bacterium]|nr:PAS domain-containing protein [Desulfobacteraceae bacterium]